MQHECNSSSLSSQQPTCLILALCINRHAQFKVHYTLDGVFDCPSRHVSVSDPTEAFEYRYRCSLRCSYCGGVLPCNVTLWPESDNPFERGDRQREAKERAVLFQPEGSLTQRIFKGSLNQTLWLHRNYFWLGAVQRRGIWRKYHGRCGLWEPPRQSKLTVTTGVKVIVPPRLLDELKSHPALSFKASIDNVRRNRENQTS